MDVIEISRFGGPEVLKLSQRPIPKPEANQILIRNVAAGINRPDVLQRKGSYAPPAGASDLPGLESAGVIVDMGVNVSKWNIGDNVCALLPGGGYAQYSLTHADHALPIPKGIDLRQAAALCETFFTVWSNVFTRGKLKSGETFLVHGGTSGIGTTAIQLAKAFGARVFATAGTDEKCDLCRELGADSAINYRKDDFVDIILRETNGGGVNLILDMVGGDYLPRNIKSLANDGRLVLIAFLKWPKVELNFAHILTRRLTITGSTLRPQSDKAKSRIARDLQQIVWPLLEAGIICPILNASFQLKDAAKAHALMESSAHMGKIILEISELK